MINRNGDTLRLCYHTIGYIVEYIIYHTTTHSTLLNSSTWNISGWFSKKSDQFTFEFLWYRSKDLDFFVHFVAKVWNLQQCRTRTWSSRFSPNFWRNRLGRLDDTKHGLNCVVEQEIVLLVDRIRFWIRHSMRFSQHLYKLSSTWYSITFYSSPLNDMLFVHARKCNTNPFETIISLQFIEVFRYWR